MENNKIDLFMLFNSGNFEEKDIPKIQSRIKELPDESSAKLFSTEFKKPTTALIISFLGGSLGIDRFYLGQTGNGVLKLITCGGFGLWAIIDLFLIMGAAREHNTIKLISILNAYKNSANSSQMPQNTVRPSESSDAGSITSAPNKATDVTAYMPTHVATENYDSASESGAEQQSANSTQSAVENQAEASPIVEPAQPNVEPEQPIVENAGSEYTKTY